MGSEIELKFQVSSQEMKSLRAARSLRPMDAALTEGEKLLSVYFDTAERRLRRKGISLRVRHNGDGRVQTIKTQRRTFHLAAASGSKKSTVISPICDPCGARRLRSCGPKS